jgi:hypothetical protein
MNAQTVLMSAFHCSSRGFDVRLAGPVPWQVPQSARREDDSALNARHSWFFVNRVRQQQNGSAEKQCVEEKVQRNPVCGRGQEHRQALEVRSITSSRS